MGGKNLRDAHRLVGAVILALLLTAATPATAHDVGSQIALTGRVVDDAGVLTVDERDRLTSRLSDYERRTRHQLVLVTVRSLRGQSIEAFSLDLFNRRGIGRRGYNDGVLILVAPTERRTRIEVGRGIERKLTNKICARIIDAKMLPHFRKRDFAGGLSAGSDAILVTLP